ncbi:hypothetical protein THAOC_33805 [Thalassiosira oceanica]|uniref:Sulfotransferase domain-containing protein n=1 Tax=Thalassiosira oceanica TaxID=159749 RepID=K0R3J4_THAOC|nr:hypothetical protein THAOC_33805 [Thalassiosira oceanica]|eukprot:EJK47468.1 hypothetical protein THAOC_33805 [Thalassiosira oceanica]
MTLDFQIMSPSLSPPAVQNSQVGRVSSLLVLLTALMGCGAIFNTRGDRLNRQLSLDEYLADSAAQRAKLENETAVDAETKAMRRKVFLGGIYPEVDERRMPLHLRNVVRDQDDPSNHAGQSNSNDLVYFWHVPKASGSTIKNVLNYCFELRRAEKTQDVASMEYPRSPRVLNMDTATPDGLQHSLEQDLTSSGLVDVIISNYFLGGAALFNADHQAQTFTVLRHPIEQAFSLFHYRKRARWERSYRADLRKVHFREYISSPSYVDNWLTRQLTNSVPGEELTEGHFNLAKLILNTKIFVGLQDEMDETLRLLAAHFGWEEVDTGCVDMVTHEKFNSMPHPVINGGRQGPIWRIASMVEKWDIRLYNEALDQFERQREQYPASHPAPVKVESTTKMSFTEESLNPESSADDLPPVPNEVMQTIFFPERIVTSSQLKDDYLSKTDDQR